MVLSHALVILSSCPGSLCACARVAELAAYYGWETTGTVIKRPRKAGDPVPPTKWVVMGHSMGTFAMDDVRGPGNMASL